MTTITYRYGLGRPLTTAEMDANWRSIVNNKVEVVAGKGLSTNDYIAGDKSKVSTIGNSAATGALADAYLLARANHTGTQAISTVVNLQSTLDAKIPLTQKGAASGVAPLDSNSLIPAVYLPSYVDDVLEFANLAAFPTTGETGKIYVAIDTGKIYRWSSTIYVEISGLNTALTGLSTTSATAVAATDSILVAIGKLQGQISEVVAWDVYLSTAQSVSSGTATRINYNTIVTNSGVTITNSGATITINKSGWYELGCQFRPNGDSVTLCIVELMINGTLFRRFAELQNQTGTTNSSMLVYLTAGQALTIFGTIYGTTNLTFAPFDGTGKYAPRFTGILLKAA